MFGNKKDFDGNKTIANGCIQEYRIAKSKKRIIIPIGSTGDAAAVIYEAVKIAHDKDKETISICIIILKL